MAKDSPELVFVAGPQQGERAAVTADPTVMGRSPTCQIWLREEFASREQLRFENSPQGWLMENLSAKGTRINGRRYKSGKKLQLATGDTLGIGMTTEILYVAAGDDADEAIKAYCQRRATVQPSAGAAEDEAAAPARPAEVKGNSNDTKTKTGIMPAVAAEDEPSAPAAVSDAENARKKAKRRKYAIGFAIYAVILLGLITAFKVLQNRNQEIASGPALLTKMEISDALREPMRQERKPADAERELVSARAKFAARSAGASDLYLVMRNYKLYLAHKEGPAVMDESADNDAFNRIQDELADALTSQYNTAYALERNQDWERARLAFEKVLKMIPETDENTKVRKVICQNVYDHLTYIGRQKKLK